MKLSKFFKGFTTLTVAIFLAGIAVASSGEEDSQPSHNSDTHEHAGEGAVKAAEFNTEYIIHHVLDSYEWHIFDLPAGDGEYKPVTVPLPMFVWADGQLHTFMSSEFEHGHATVESGGLEFAIHHGELIAHKDGKEVSYVDFSITKSVLAMFICAILMFWIFGSAARFYKRGGAAQSPRGMARFVEPLILFVRDEIAIPQIGKDKYQRFMPYLLTVFFFIWISNLLGLLPFGFNLTGNIAITFTLAVFTMLITNVNGNKHYWGHIFAPPGVPVALLPIMIPIELIGVFTKPFALMIRLFANITAGHIVIMCLIGVMFLKQSIAWSGLSLPLTLFISVIEVLVAALQAYIFTILSALFIGGAVHTSNH